MWTHPGKKLLFMGSDFGQWNEWDFDSSLQWHLMQWDSHQGLSKCVADLNRLYRAEKALHEVDFDGRTVDMNGISELDYDKVKMFEQESLTRIQRELVLAGVESIHKALKGWDTTVLHVVLPTAPDWYVEETVTLVDRAVPSGDNRVVNAGRVPPDTDDFSGEIFNAHAGRHFTPEFNRYWTEKLAALLGALDV
jgi:hypothetical protein